MTANGNLLQLQFSRRRINFERIKNGVDTRAVECYDFEVRLDQEECLQSLQ